MHKPWVQSPGRERKGERAQEKTEKRERKEKATHWVPMPHSMLRGLDQFI